MIKSKALPVEDINEMTKEKFTKVVKELVSLIDDEEGVRNACRKLDPDFSFVSFGRFTSLIMQLLSIAVNDKHDWISYWVYDRDCGRNTKLGDVTSKDGKKIPIKTISNLWNIVKNKDL